MTIETRGRDLQLLLERSVAAQLDDAHERKSSMLNRNLILLLIPAALGVFAEGIAEARTIAAVAGQTVNHSQNYCIGPAGAWDTITNTCGNQITVCWALPVDDATNYTVRIYGQQTAQNNVSCFVDTQLPTGGEGSPPYRPQWNTFFWSGTPSYQNFPIAVGSGNDLFACCAINPGNSVFMLNY